MNRQGELFSADLTKSAVLDFCTKCDRKIIVEQVGTDGAVYSEYRDKDGLCWWCAKDKPRSRWSKV